MTGLFVTGTDTGCGKTEASCALMAAFQARGQRVLGMKPVASGCERGPAGLRNDDALRLLTQGTTAAPYGLVNPYSFEPPIAPHVAAGQVGVQIELPVIAAAFASLAREADLVVVEGVGGWRVPLGPTLQLDAIPRALRLPVVLVVGLKLGCINHALLTAESIHSSGIRLAGWIASRVDPGMEAADATLATLATLIEAPCLGTLPWLPDPDPDELAKHLTPDLL